MLGVLIKSGAHCARTLLREIRPPFHGRDCDIKDGHEIPNLGIMSPTFPIHFNYCRIGFFTGRAGFLSPLSRERDRGLIRSELRFGFALGKFRVEFGVWVWLFNEVDHYNNKIPTTRLTPADKSRINNHDINKPSNGFIIIRDS